MLDRIIILIQTAKYITKKIKYKLIIDYILCLEIPFLTFSRWDVAMAASGCMWSATSSLWPSGRA